MKSFSTAFKLFLAADWVLLHPSFFVYGQDCFYPNGNLAAGDDHPCSSDGHGPCCPLNWQCLSNGLCYLENEGYLGRYTCTDSTWESDNCPKICLHGGTASGNEAILECSPGSYCCDANRPEIGCCQTSKDFFPLPDGTVVASIGANGPEQPPAAGSSLTAAASSESGGKIITTAERDLVAQNSITQSGSVLPSFTPFSITKTTVPSSTDRPSETENAETSTSTPAPMSSIILITSVVINSAGITFTSVTAQIAGIQSGSSLSPAESSQQSSTSNSGLKIGLGVGIPVGVVALALVGFFVLRRRRTNNSRRLSQATEKARTDGSNPMEYMYKGQGDADSPQSATTTSPQLNQRASSKYVVHDTEDGGYRGVKTGGHSGHGGLGLHPGSPELPLSPTRSELSGNPSVQRDYRNSQFSDLTASLQPPSELPDRPYQ